MRELIVETDFAIEQIQTQLQSMDFTNTICSPLINGGCGLGKTTALTHPSTYKIFQEKLDKLEPHILFIESRAITRDQQKEINTNPNYLFVQFETAARLSIEQLNSFDIIIIDEAHSLFTDSEFAARSTAPLCDWLKNDCNVFQIYITASDLEFIDFAEHYFVEKEFQLTFPNIEEESHVRYCAQQIVLSINTRKTESVIELKESTFFKEGNRGIFFIWSAANASELYKKYLLKGYKCAFYISQNNSTKIIKKDQNATLIAQQKKDEEEDDDFLSYTSHYIQISVYDFYEHQERTRKNAGLPTVRESLIQGKVPDDIDFLFITSVGQEGISLSVDNNFNFIFIEDTYPLTINQKIFRYRGNVPYVYISLPQRRLEKMFLKTLEKLLEMRSWSQDKLEGFYLGSKNDKSGYGRLIWKDRNGVYRVAENFISYALVASKTFRTVRDNKENYDFLRATYGQYGQKFIVENLTEESTKEKVVEYFETLIGKEFSMEETKSIVRDLKKLGLTNAKQRYDYSFAFIKKYCKEKSICEIISKRKMVNGKQQTFYKILKVQ